MGSLLVLASVKDLERMISDIVGETAGLLLSVVMLVFILWILMRRGYTGAFVSIVERSLQPLKLTCPNHVIASLSGIYPRYAQSWCSDQHVLLVHLLYAYNAIYPHITNSGHLHSRGVYWFYSSVLPSDCCRRRRTDSSCVPKTHAKETSAGRSVERIKKSTLGYHRRAE